MLSYLEPSFCRRRWTLVKLGRAAHETGLWCLCIVNPGGRMYLLRYEAEEVPVLDWGKDEECAGCCRNSRCKFEGLVAPSWATSFPWHSR